MALPSWCTLEQCIWFVEQFAKFHQARLEGTVGDFLAAAVKEILEHWPILQCAETIDGNSPEDVEKQAQQDLHYQKQKEQIENRFNNNHSKAHIAAAATASGKSLTTSPKKKIIYSLWLQCRLRAVQIYSKCYYKAHVQPAIKKVIRQSLTPLTCCEMLTIINKLTHETFQSESKAIKAKVFEALKQRHEEQAKASHKGQQTPEDYLDAIDAAPPLLEQFLNDLAVQTGWWFTVIAGSPDPANRNELKRNFEQEYTHHCIDPKDTSTHHTTFEEGVVTPYGRFLKTLFLQGEKRA
ncbi:hypothetical protein IW261DRAFT_1424534 [Armillaria novae-zelandiae]|uniref:Uncharacterized protein n=1 Tax=Armillaria novae-zelandiae TaxID=153914 RepID=A0AA39NUJ7_9AGAR|nr:hypothetical protein IW261DRAFT_1424534 [Armillaria novae-zelandiae]